MSIKKHRQYDLHKGCYRALREQFGLSANLAVRAIARVAPRLANAKTRHSKFKPTSIDYDARIFKLNVESETVQPASAGWPLHPRAGVGRLPAASACGSAADQCDAQERTEESLLP